MRDVRMWHEDSILNEASSGLTRLRIELPPPGSSARCEGEDGAEVADLPDPGAAMEVWRRLVGRAERLDGVEVCLTDE